MEGIFEKWGVHEGDFLKRHEKEENFKATSAESKFSFATKHFLFGGGQVPVTVQHRNLGLGRGVCLVLFGVIVSPKEP